MKPTERLRLVLEKMVVPYYDNIDRVSVRQFGALGERFYDVSYFVSKGVKLDRSIMREVIKKTTSLFNMLGLEKGSDVSVSFF